MTPSSPRRPWDGGREAGCDVLLTAAAVLHANGEETSGTLEAAELLNERLGLGATLVPGWSDLLLHVGGDRVRMVPAVASNNNMNRVVGALHAVDAIAGGRLDAAGATAALAAAARAPQSPLGRYVFACAVGAGALSIINGASHPAVLGIVVLCAGVGGLLRRGMAHWFDANSFLQILAASLLAGFVGAFGVRWEAARQINAATRLIALGPLLVLVPGPAFLAGALDVAAFRLTLGFARLLFGTLTVLAICTGVLVGLALGGADLPATAQARPLPVWLDVVCAGVAAGSYGVFFAMPPRLIVYPVLMGMAAHAVRWCAISGLGWSNATGAGLACLTVGVVMVPVARRYRLPFAGVGFASVVSMVPGTYLFRMGGGLMQIQHDAAATSAALVGGVLSDGTTALMTVTTMALGLVLPMSAYKHVRRTRAGGV
ncbi:hypothetical protein tb265_42680 [Gemmatimonadetes bacterium T265]|nr:hypothetical protein tb265_42680 [Gemmatimonadetes bacterium T265]